MLLCVTLLSVCQCPQWPTVAVPPTRPRWAATSPYLPSRHRRQRQKRPVRGMTTNPWTSASAQAVTAGEGANLWSELDPHW